MGGDTAAGILRNGGGDNGGGRHGDTGGGEAVAAENLPPHSIPAKAGISAAVEIPAFAGMEGERGGDTATQRHTAAAEKKDAGFLLSQE